MRDNLHRCYSCAAEAAALCQRCAAMSCLDHLAARPISGPYSQSHLLLCSACLVKTDKEKQRDRCLLMLAIFGCLLLGLVAAGR